MDQKCRLKIRIGVLNFRLPNRANIDNNLRINKRGINIIIADSVLAASNF